MPERFAGNAELHREIDQLIKAGRYDVAASLALSSLKTDIAMPKVAATIAMTFARKGQLQQAAAFLSYALSIKPEDVELLNCQVALIRSSGKSAEALKLCLRIIDLAPADAAGYANLALCYSVVGNYAAASVALEKANGLQPGDASVLAALGNTLQQQGRLKESAAAFKQVIAIAPNVVAPYRSLAEVAIRQNETDVAIGCLQKLTELLPESAVAKADLATLLIEDEQLDRAGVLLAEALALDPDSAAVHGLLGRFSQLQGRFSEAVSSFEKAISINPNEVVAYSNLPFCKTFSEADRPMLETALALSTEPQLKVSQAAQLHFAIGKGLDDLKDYENALLHYDLANAKALQERLSQGEAFDRTWYRHAYEQARITFSSQFIKLKEDLASSSQVPIFVVGMLRSGTTLVEQILSSHREVAAGGEMPFWSTRAEELFDKVTGNFSDLRAMETSRDYLEELDKVDTNAKRVTDKLPSNIIHLGLLYALFPNAKAILCRRDPVDVALSIYKTPNRVAPLFAHKREDIVFAIQRTSEIADHWLKMLPKTWLMSIQYEELITDTEARIRELVEFCGLDWDDACLRHDQNKRVVKTPSFWQVRQPIYSESVGRWRRYEPWLGAFSKLI
ncbi:MAG TPA: sulfotransferase [Fimbriimonadaceae bacterium]|jgi:tetratricopeptide (TPR) repeat protein